MRSSDIYYQDQLAGLLWEADQGLYHFQYSADFIASHLPPITPNLPKRTHTYTSPHWFPVFYAMLSEGGLREFQEQAWKIEPGDDFGLLRVIARHDTIGALTLRNTDLAHTGLPFRFGGGACHQNTRHLRCHSAWCRKADKLVIPS